jgi:hypothetical protein
MKLGCKADVLALISPNIWAIPEIGLFPAVKFVTGVYLI